MRALAGVGWELNMSAVLVVMDRPEQAGDGGQGPAGAVFRIVMGRGPVGEGQGIL